MQAATKRFNKLHPACQVLAAPTATDATACAHMGAGLSRLRRFVSPYRSHMFRFADIGPSVIGAQNGAGLNAHRTPAAVGHPEVAAWNIHLEEPIKPS